MLDIHRTDTAPDTKFYFSHSVLPSYIDPHNVSTKKKPFSAFNKQQFSHSLDLILPEEMYELVQHQLQQVDGLAESQYAKVHMKLGEILEAEFLDGYIKQGSIMMLSEGRPLLDNRFELFEGKLRMELTRPTYERCGIQGNPVEDGGKKHQKQRWVVEYDLRSPSMKNGKKCFSRLQWACNNVLDQSLTWLFYNFNPSSTESLAEGKEPISKHAPWIHRIEPSETKLEHILVPKLSARDLPSLYSEEDALDLLEYLQLLSLNSPRLKASDNIDPYLSRYEVPDSGNGIVTKNMVRVRWTGFIPPAFVRGLFIMTRRVAFKCKSSSNGTQDGDMEDDSAIRDTGVENRWFAMSAQGFGGKTAWTVMQFAPKETLTWETEA